MFQLGVQRPHKLILNESEDEEPPNIDRRHKKHVIVHAKKAKSNPLLQEWKLLKSQYPLTAEEDLHFQRRCKVCGHFYTKASPGVCRGSKKAVGSSRSLPNIPKILENAPTLKGSGEFKIRPHVEDKNFRVALRMVMIKEHIPAAPGVCIYSNEEDEKVHWEEHSSFASAASLGTGKDAGVCVVPSCSDSDD